MRSQGDRTLHTVIPKEEVEGRALEKSSEFCKHQPGPFAVAKANRAEVIQSRYEKKHKAKIGNSIDCR